MLQLRFVVGILSLSLMAHLAGVVSAQDYPNKPIRIITAQVGGGSDFDARQVAQGLSKSLGQQVIVDNRPPGTIQGEMLSRAPADGYTLLVNGGPFWTFPLLQKAPYDVVKDFSPISMIARSVNVLVVYPSLQANSVRELIALAKARPGELNYGSGPTGGGAHLGMELFKYLAGVNIVRIPYKGGSLQLPDLIAGRVQMTGLDTGTVAPHVKSGKLRALAVTSAEPTALAPGLPTVAASGLPGYEAIGTTGMWAPAKTPGAIINQLSREIIRYLSLPEVKERFLSSGEEATGSSPEHFAAVINSDIAKLGKMIKDVGIKAD